MRRKFGGYATGPIRTAEYVAVATTSVLAAVGCVALTLQLVFVERACAQSQLADPLTASVGYRFTDDDNVYRLPDGLSASTLVGPQASRRDHIHALTASLDGQWSFGMQAFLLNAKINQSHYVDNDALDNTAGNGKLSWNWRFGPVLSGDVGTEIDRSLADFANTGFLDKDLLTRSSTFASARWQVGGRWALLGGLRQTDASHGADSQQINNFHSQAGNVGVEYGADPLNMIWFDYRRLQQNFSHELFLGGGFYDASFDEDTWRVRVRRQLLAKTTLDLSGGYLKRSYPYAAVRTLSGGVWRTSINWQPSGKTQVVLSGWRELRAYLDSESEYFISTGASIAPQWMPTEKLTVKLTYSFERLNYVDAPTALDAGVARRDRPRSCSALVEFAPRDALLLSASFRDDRRASNRDRFQYGARVFYADIKFKF